MGPSAARCWPAWRPAAGRRLAQPWTTLGCGHTRRRAHGRDADAGRQHGPCLLLAARVRGGRDGHDERQARAQPGAGQGRHAGVSCACRRLLCVPAAAATRALRAALTLACVRCCRCSAQAEQQQAQKQQQQQPQSQQQQAPPGVSLEVIPRSREVGQSYVTSVATTLYSLLFAAMLVFRHRPQLVSALRGARRPLLLGHYMPCLQQLCAVWACRRGAVAAHGCCCCCHGCRCWSMGRAPAYPCALPRFSAGARAAGAVLHACMPALPPPAGARNCAHRAMLPPLLLLLTLAGC